MMIEGLPGPVGVHNRSKSSATLTSADSREVAAEFSSDGIEAPNKRKKSQANVVRRQSSIRNRDITVY
jgi:hypothetical protein